MTDQANQIEQDYQNYKVLLDLWSKENPIKTTKLQMLLAVNGLLASAVNISGGVSGSKWYIYLAAAVRGGSGWLDSFAHSLSGASRVVDYAAVRRVVRFS
jgi:hypothetical protein